MTDTQTLRLCVLQYDDDGEVVMFAAGWDLPDPDNHKAQDDQRRTEAESMSTIDSKFLTSVRFLDVEVPISADLVLVPND